MQQPNTLKFLFDSIWSFRRYFYIHLFVVVFGAVEISLWPYVSKLLIDKVSMLEQGQIFAQIWPLTFTFIFLTFLPGFVWRLADYAWAYLVPFIKKKIMIDASERMLEKSQNFYQNNQAGACANRVKELANNTPRLLNIIIYNFFGVFLGLTIALYTTWHVHKFFALTLCLWAGVFVYMAVRSAKLTDEMSANIATQQSKIVGNIVDIFTNIQNVKFFANQQREKERVAYLQNRYTIFYKHRGFFLLRFYTMHGLTFSFYFAVSIVALIYFYARGKVTIGDFALIFTINNWMIHAMWTATSQIQGFLEDYGAVKQALKMVYRPLEVEDKKDADELELKGENGGAEITFDNVSFSYRLLNKPSREFKPLEFQAFARIDKKNAVLVDKEDLHIDGKLVIQPGEKIGLVGESGGGKTTFINLIMRSYDVNKGGIFIDGQNISDVKQNSLRDKITVIPQEPLLFHRTLFENISYAKDNAKQEEVFEAAKLAYCAKFIDHLPKGYRTLVGDRGVKLSGGQRQRIAIARAFLKDAPILIMDEGTSQLDSVTEGLIQRGVEKLIKGRTAIIVAHRLSTLRNVDRILVFEGGRVVEDGGHDELMGVEGGVYRGMWEEQVGGMVG